MRTLVIPTGGQITPQSDLQCHTMTGIHNNLRVIQMIVCPSLLGSKKQGNNIYISNFTAIATTDLNISLVQCLGPNRRPDNPDLVGSDTIQIIGYVSYVLTQCLNCRGITVVGVSLPKWAVINWVVINIDLTFD